MNRFSASMRFTTVPLLLLAWAQPAPADIIHVHEGESIQAAIDGCAGGDEIIVHPGTYVEAVDFLGKAIWLHSAAGPEVTIIDGKGADPVVQCISGEGSDTILEGFTVTDVYLPGSYGGMYNWYSSPTVIDCRFSGNDGGGMMNDHSHPTVANCSFIDNWVFDWGGGLMNSYSNPLVIDCAFIGNLAAWLGGGGMMNQHSSPIVINCTFIDNETQNCRGGGMANDDSSPIITNCTFVSNWTWYGGGGMENRGGSSPTISNCVFIGNSTLWGVGGAMVNDNSSPTVVCSTFTGNASGDGIGGIESYGTSCPVITNCILWGDSGGEISGDARVTYSNVFGGYPGEGNIEANPFFVDPTGGDLRLQSQSPCTDAGRNGAVPSGVTTDLDGHPRFVDDACVPDSGSGTPPIVDMGAFERQEDSVGPITVNVPGDFNTIQEAIVDSSHGDEIIVHPGTYFEVIDLLGKAIWLHSSGGSEATIIDGSGFEHVVQCVNWEGPNTILEGFTITGGASTNNGGGMYNARSAPTVVGCTFTDNTAVTGGGMYNLYANPRVASCTFSNNHVSDGGGGMDNDHSSPNLINCVFAGNSASFGGGLHSYISTPNVTNCTFTDNAAIAGGGISTFGNIGPKLSNCILWGDEGTEINVLATVAYSNVEGGWPGDGNIDVDPLFVDPDNGDYRLSPGSPCIDAGHNWGVPVDQGDFDGDGDTCELFPVDLDGMPRCVDDPSAPDTGCGSPVIVDMGAYEFQVPGAPPIEIIFGDIDGNGIVDVLDLLAVIGAWGPAPGCTLADLDMNGTVDVLDLLRSLAVWGPCP